MTVKEALAGMAYRLSKRYRETGSVEVGECSGGEPKLNGRDLEGYKVFNAFFEGSSSSDPRRIQRHVRRNKALQESIGYAII